MSRNKIPIEKFTSLEIDVGEAIDETLDELQAVDKNWYLTEEEKKILAESNDPEFDFFGLTSSERNIILEKMKQHKTSSETCTVTYCDDNNSDTSSEESTDETRAFSDFIDSIADDSNVLDKYFNGSDLSLEEAEQDLREPKSCYHDLEGHLRFKY